MSLYIWIRWSFLLSQGCRDTWLSYPRVIIYICYGLNVKGPLLMDVFGHLISKFGAVWGSCATFRNRPSWRKILWSITRTSWFWNNLFPLPGWCHVRSTYKLLPPGSSLLLLPCLLPHDIQTLSKHEPKQTLPPLCSFSWYFATAMRKITNIVSLFTLHLLNP